MDGGLNWGTGRVPESQLQVLGDVTGMDILELGCGAAQWSIGLARAGAPAGRPRQLGPPAGAREAAHGRGRRRLPGRPCERRGRAAAGSLVRHRVLRPRRDDVRGPVPDRPGGGPPAPAGRPVRVQPPLADRDDLLAAGCRDGRRPARPRLLRDAPRRRWRGRLLPASVRRVDPPVPRERVRRRGPHRAAAGPGRDEQLPRSPRSSSGHDAGPPSPSGACAGRRTPIPARPPDDRPRGRSVRRHSATGRPRPHRRRRAGRPVPGRAAPVDRRPARSGSTSGGPSTRGRGWSCSRRTSSRTRSRRTRPTCSTGRTSRRSSTRPSSRRGSPTGARSPPTSRRCSRQWTLGFVALKTIEQSLADLIEAPRDRHGRARRRRGHARRRARAARAGRHRRRHHGHAVPVPRRPRPGWRRTGPPEPDAGPPRVRAGRDVPVQPALRLQRVLQVLQERREHGVQVHPRRPAHVLRRLDQPRDRHRRDQQGRVRRDALDGSTGRGSASTTRRSRSPWTGSSRRSRRRPTASSSASSRSCASRSTSTTRGT